MRSILRLRTVFLLAAVPLFLLLLFPNTSYAGEDFFDVFYDADVRVSLKLKSLPRTEIVRLRGPVEIRQALPADLDGDGKPDIQTEILSMSLTGATPQGLAVNLNSSKSNIYRSLGMAEQLLIHSGRGRTNPVANSFFDVFTELSLGSPPDGITVVPPFDVFLTEKPFHLEATARSLTDLSGNYSTRKNITVTLFREGVPAGTLTMLAVNLNSSKSN